MSDIQEQIQKERETARQVCSTEGDSSNECAVAWDAVEELSAEAAHQKQKAPKKSSLEIYCDDNPDALECRVYED
jgi:hypothetical protein